MNLRLVLWDQLTQSLSSLDDANPEEDVLVFLETLNETSYVNHHVKKLAFLLSAMRHFSLEMQEKGFTVFYREIASQEVSLTTGMKKAIARFKPSKIIATTPGEYRIQQEISSWKKQFGVSVEIREDNRFFCSTEQFAAWANGKKSLVLEPFYRMMRKESGLLMDKEGKPCGGEWNYDKENRNPLQADLKFPGPHRTPPDKLTQEVLKEVKKRFSKHFGDLEPFWFAVTASQAKKALHFFIQHALPFFGLTQDAMLEEESFLHHSLISHYLNVGLLDPKEVCAAVESAYLAKKVPIQSAEGFIRQILGWREFVRGIYWLHMPSYAKLNFFHAKRKLPWFYWTGKTEMNCLKQVILKTKKEAYSHHIQRLMITGNFALLIGALPEEVSAWYLAVYADAHEWVELPNTLGMAQFADGGLLATKPYCSSGSYINKMSDFCTQCVYDVEQKEGKKACPFNYLYWDFLMRNKKLLEKNPRLGMAYKTLEGFTKAKKEQIQKDASSFLKNLEKQDGT